jgi:hypothetical protein
MNRRRDVVPLLMACVRSPITSRKCCGKGDGVLDFAASGLRGWSGHEDDGSADVAASCLGECLGGVGEAVAGGDRNPNLPVSESLREFAQLVSVPRGRRCWRP